MGAEYDKISKNRITVETDKLTFFAILVKERSDSVFKIFHQLTAE